MTEDIDLNDFDAVARKYHALVRLKVRQFCNMNPGYSCRLKHDLFQEAFIALWIATKTYNGRIPFINYAAILIERGLFRCIRFRYYLQREESIPEYPEFCMVYYDDPAQPVVQSDLFEHVVTVAKRVLTKRQYQSLRYRFLSNPQKPMSFAAIGKRLHCKTAAARSLCNEALFKLRLAFNVPTNRKARYTQWRKENGLGIP